MNEIAQDVRLNRVVRRYESAVETVWAVRDVSFAAVAGQFVCIQGASGSGKSTLLNLMAGLDVADSGDIQVGNTLVSRLDEEGRAQLRLNQVGVVFQDGNLISEFTAAENVALPLQASGVGRSEALALAAQKLDEVGLAGLGHRFPAQLSGGQQQRVGVARALVGGRRILLADEPTGALDSNNSTDLYKLLRTLCDGGALAIVCSHDPECLNYADVVYHMRDGSLSVKRA